MDADDIGALFAALIGMLIFALAWWADREHKKLLEEIYGPLNKVRRIDLHGRHRATATRAGKPGAERRPPSQSSPR